jgi:hypothetical protein
MSRFTLVRTYLRFTFVQQRSKCGLRVVQQVHTRRDILMQSYTSRPLPRCSGALRSHKAILRRSRALIVAAAEGPSEVEQVLKSS